MGEGGRRGERGGRRVLGVRKKKPESRGGSGGREGGRVGERGKEEGVAGK